MKILFLLLSLSVTSFAQSPNCVGFFNISENRAPITFNGKTPKNFSIGEIPEGKSSAHAELSTDIVIDGIILNIVMTDGQSGPLMTQKNIKYNMDKRVLEFLQIKETGKLETKDALHYVSLDTLIALREARDDFAIRKAFEYEFLLENKITETKTGLYHDTSWGQLKHPEFNIVFQLNSDGTLKSIDFGNTPTGIYKLEFLVKNKDGKNRFRSFFLVIDSN